MRIVVTGATGHVGTALLKRLREARSQQSADLQIVGIARRKPDQNTAPYRDIEWHSVDIGDQGALPALARAFAGADAVVHLAWLIQPNHDRELLRRTNVEGTAHVLNAARTAGVGHIVCASSVGAYSPAPKTLESTRSGRQTAFGGPITVWTKRPRSGSSTALPRKTPASLWHGSDLH